MVLEGAADTHRVEVRLLSAVARLGTIALEGMALGELRDEACRVASAALGAEVTLHDETLQVTSRPLAPHERDFLQVVDPDPHRRGRAWARAGSTTR